MIIAGDLIAKGGVGNLLPLVGSSINVWDVEVDHMVMAHVANKNRVLPKNMKMIKMNERERKKNVTGIKMNNCCDSNCEVLVVCSSSATLF